MIYCTKCGSKLVKVKAVRGNGYDELTGKRRRWVEEGMKCPRLIGWFGLLHALLFQSWDHHDDLRLIHY